MVVQGCGGGGRVGVGCRQTANGTFAMKEVLATELWSWLHHYTFTETHQTKYLQWLNFKACKFHLNKTKNKQREKERCVN